MPLAVATFDREPSAEAVTALCEKAIAAHRSPRYVVTDRGTQFSADAFKTAMKRHAVRQRFGAVGQTRAVAVIDRFWRTMKELLGIQVLKPLFQEDLERRLADVLGWYCVHRPHLSLGGATPAEVFLGLAPANSNADQPPRASPAARAGPAPFTVEYADRECRLPILKRAA
jgi:putative transposase